MRSAASRRRSTAGMTLIEVLIAVTIMGMLVVGMSLALRVGLSAFGRTTDRLMEDRRVAGAQRVLQSELEGLMPVMPVCPPGQSGGGSSFVFFQAEPQFLRMVSTFSLQQGWRGAPQILEFFTLPAAQGRGVRLVVNEIPYTPSVAGSFCRGLATDPTLGVSLPLYPPEPQAMPTSFVLADNLAYCKFSYYSRSTKPDVPGAFWLTRATGLGWPLAIRIDMAPLEPDLVKLQPISVVANMRLHRTPGIPYGDF